MYESSYYSSHTTFYFFLSCTNILALSFKSLQPFMKNDVWHFSFIFRAKKESHLQHFKSHFFRKYFIHSYFIEMSIAWYADK